ncbi:ArnT family glycosyltransferase [Methanococcoides seepicolus]|uniref:Glycosyltransferase family 39 protein n=1 Tax=Methanococcoides seepicolus TaxID=2828780 RepID=A0A9E5DD81_9EURY|nr:glycosyltransferase family 39 protein [Methanococcoides seepicolus]MCM1987223.1 glycosyltransferase family 39 protein [Methanococcoides seepicolus]MCM1987504.1 glycosyltransferase family 39 protein [Methanococcoides seepicolus]
MRSLVEKYRNTLLDVTGNLFILGLISLILHHFTSIIVSVWIDISLLAIITFTSGFSWFFIFIQKDEEYFKAKTEPYFRNLFLAGLLVISIGSLTFEFIESSQLLSSVVSFISSIQFYLVLATIGFGFFTFYFNRERIEAEAELEQERDAAAERKRDDEFDRKFAILTRFNLDYAVSENWNRRDYGALAFRGLIAPFVWIARLPYSFVKWTYKEGWFYSIVLLLIMLLGIYLRIYNLGNLSLGTDEIYLGIAMKSILENGVPSLPDGAYYNRGLTHSYLSSFFALFLGANEFSVRLPSAISGLGTILILYFLGKEIQNKKMGLMLSFILCIFPWAIEFSRWGRMYSMVTFLILFTFYSSIIGFKHQNKNFVILAIISALLAIMTHKFGYITPLIILIAAVLYTFEFKKEILKIKYLLIIFLPILLIPLAHILINIRENNFTFGKIFKICVESYGFTTKHSFSDYFINFLFSNYVLLFIGIITLFYYLVQRRINIKDNLFLFGIASLQIGLLSYYHLHETTRYLFFIMPLFITIAIIGYKELLQNIFSKYLDSNKTSILVMATIIIITVISIAPLNYSISIPSRTHGDTYDNPYYAPTTVSDYVPDWKSNNIYIRDNDNNNATIISNGYQFTYYYNKEPDYYLRPGNSNYFSRKIGNDSYMRYMDKTILIHDKEQFSHIINETDNTIYIAFNSRGGHLDKTITAEKWINDVEKNGNNFKLVFVGDDPNSKVYKLE